MKKIVFIILIFLPFFTFSQAETIVLKSNGLSIGFGRESNLSKHLDVVVNGPLVDTIGVPVGGYIDNYTIIKKWANPRKHEGNFSIDNGIFGVRKNGKPFLVDYSKRKEVFVLETMWAFQNGLILIQDGKNKRGTSTSKYPRSGIGYDQGGELIIIVSLEEITLRDFANLFLQEECTDAIYLDGGPYTFFNSQVVRAGQDKKAIKMQFFHQCNN